ncbi:GLPK protein, partial [Polypterus senegalus]
MWAFLTVCTGEELPTFVIAPVANATAVMAPHVIKKKRKWLKEVKKKRSERKRKGKRTEVTGSEEAYRARETDRRETRKPFHNFISWQDLRATELVKSWNSSYLMKVADQQAAMFGECCFNVGDIKITMGTGTFMDINTGSKPHTSIAGLYPVIGWKIGQELVYLAEGNAADTGTAVKWAQQLSLFSDAAETETMATNVSDSEGVCFVPSFSGLQAPLNDPRACASFMGLKPTTTKNHLVRAILESIAFRADGGVCSNNFVMQLTSDLLNQKIDRPKHVEMSSLGAAFIAGLGIGFWSNTEELKCLRSTEKVFLPKNANKNYEHIIDMWEEALKRSMHWYSKR